MFTNKNRQGYVVTSICLSVSDLYVCLSTDITQKLLTDSNEIVRIARQMIQGTMD